MQLKFKNSFIGYYKFYYNVIGFKVIINLALCVVVSFLDGMGLTMFMPLLQSVGEGTANAGKKSMGQLHYLTDVIQSLGVPLSLNTVLIILVALFSFKGIVKFLQMNYQVSLRTSFMRNVRSELINKLQKLSYSGFLKLDAGRIQNTLTAEAQRLFQTMTFYFNAAQAAVMLLTYIVLAFLANYQFALLVAAGAGISNFLFRKIYKATKKASVEVSKKGDNFNSYLIQAVNHFKYLKATNYFAHFSKKIKYVINETEQLNKKMGVYSAITVSVKEPIIFLVVAGVIFLQLNVMGASLSSILLSLLLFYRALMFLMNVQNYWQSFIQNIGSMSSIAEISIEMASMEEALEKRPFESLQKGLELKNIIFSYGIKTILNGINVSIEKNKTIAFVGESGSGKTTLANIIAGLMPPASGNILVNDTPLHNFNLDTYRSKIGYISQEPVIFNDNIYNNITFWDGETSEDKKHFWNIIELASLTNFVKNLPDKEDTKLGDNGLLISGGQKQRISIARELYKKAEILILDEATSSLDSETEIAIKENIEKLHGSYTIIIIAHRLSTIKNADTIYLIENGRALQSGSFEEMLENSERFKRMVSLQEFN